MRRYTENHKFQAPKKFENNLIYKLETCFDKQPRQLKINNIYKKKKKKASCEVYAYLNLTYQTTNIFFSNLTIFRMASSIGNNWTFSFTRVYCSQQKYFAKKKKNMESKLF